MEETKNIDEPRSVGGTQSVGAMRSEMHQHPAKASPEKPNIETPQPETLPEPAVAAEIKPEPQPPEPPTPEKLGAEISVITDKMIGLIGIRAQVRTNVNEDGSYYVNVRSRNSDGLLIGKRGMTIVSVQAIVNQIMKHRYPTLPIDIFIDVSGYRKRGENFLKKKALAVAKIVFETKRDMALDILTEREFRMVENELAPLGTVRVYGIGSGSKRTVIIAPL